MKQISTLQRKFSQVVRDPVLREWLLGRALGRWPGEPAYAPHRPPYLDKLPELSTEPDLSAFGDLADEPPSAPIELPLPAETVRLDPGDAAKLIGRSFSDTETLLAVHRFAWLPMLGDGADPRWVNALWRAWIDRYANGDDGWAWHPYTAAERIVNLLDFAARHGLPGPRDETRAVLARHGPAIARHLEYFGELRTGNHLANNGRGLFLAGLALGLNDWADLGGRILVEEAKRIFLPSGILREGSAHYHLVVARWYAEAARAAGRHGRAEAAALAEISRRVGAVIPRLVLPGGLALVGDISPDLPPAETIERLDAAAEPVSDDVLAADGWLRAAFGPWDGLWHVAPAGWSPMPGHGHDDCGGFELHFETEPVFRDLGRRSYGPSGDADVAAAAHNTLTIDGAGPYPPNKPYYSADFRHHAAGEPPELRRQPDGVTLRHNGLARLKGVGVLSRTWRFDGSRLALTDRIDGRGRHLIRRHLHTTLPVRRTADGVDVGRFAVSGDGDISVDPATYWHAYGAGTPATSIAFESRVELPWESALTVEIA